MLNAIYSFFESLGKARAATQLTNMGYHKLAKDVMIKDEPVFEVHP